MSNGGNGEKRLIWLDALKGLAILSVVLGHVLLGYTEINLFPGDQVWMTRPLLFFTKVLTERPAFPSLSETAKLTSLGSYITVK